MTVEVRSRFSHPAIARGCSTAAGILLAGLAGFEALLAAGMPWGGRRGAVVKPSSTRGCE
jgi:hypothetical protein